MIEYRHMDTADESQVRALARRGHPTWPSRPKFWYQANPTIVAVEDGEIIGSCSYTVDNHPAGNSFIMYFRDVCVDPAHQNRGIGRALQAQRMSVGRYLGIQMFVGCTAPSNGPMRKLFTSMGFHACQRVPNHFAFNNPPEDGIIYIHSGDIDEES